MIVHRIHKFEDAGVRQRHEILGVVAGSVSLDVDAWPLPLATPNDLTSPRKPRPHRPLVSRIVNPPTWSQCRCVARTMSISSGVTPASASA